VIRGELGGAFATLTQLLRDAPPGFAAWTLPVDPLLEQLQLSQSFTGILGQLAARAR
jgi:hypothetical protein